MERKQAIEIVLGLAAENVLEARYVDNHQLQAIRDEQIEAIEIITDSEGRVCETLLPIENCPRCGETWWDSGPIDVDYGVCAQEVSCSSCPAEWQEVYQLVSRDVDPNAGQEE